jgi:hypothetical protein
MRKKSQICLVLPLALLLAALPACDTPAEAELTLIEAVRQETLKFQSASVASAAGYQADDHCVAHPQLGGMGFHWINPELVDPVFDPMKPEVLLYSTVAGGGLELTGVEYVVIDTGQSRPEFDGHPFDVGGVPPLTEAGVAHWSLHVWAHRENPAGLFTPFNPNISCD